MLPPDRKAIADIDPSIHLCTIGMVPLWSIAVAKATRKRRLSGRLYINILETTIADDQAFAHSLDWSEPVAQKLEKEYTPAATEFDHIARSTMYLPCCS